MKTLVEHILAEISQKTRRSYIKHAAADLYNRGREREALIHGHPTASSEERAAHSAKTNRRMNAISRAVDKLK